MSSNLLHVEPLQFGLFQVRDHLNGHGATGEVVASTAFLATRNPT